MSRRRLAVSVLVSSLVVLAVPSARADEASPRPDPAPVSPPASTVRSPHRVALALGFSHWFGDTFGAPDGFRTPMISAGVRPGVPFLELRLRYALALAGVALPDDGGDARDARVGFASFEVLATHGLAAGTQHLDVLAGPFATLVHADGASGGFGLVVGTQWTFAVTGALAIGVYFEGRTLFYVLAGDDRDLLDDPRHDAQIDLGVVATLG